MLKIALIDDKSYGIDYIKHLHKDEKVSIKYYETYNEFKKSKEIYDIVYLDYFLDKDGITGISILSEVKKRTKKIIGFSSVPSCNEEFIRAGADFGITKSREYKL